MHPALHDYFDARGHAEHVARRHRAGDATWSELRRAQDTESAACFRAVAEMTR